MGLWDKLKDGLAGSIDVVKKTTHEVTDKTEEMAKLLLLKKKIYEVERERARLLTEIGGNYYRLSRANDRDILSDSGIIDLLDKVKSFSDRIDELKNESEEIKVASLRGE